MFVRSIKILNRFFLLPRKYFNIFKSVGFILLLLGLLFLAACEQSDPVGNSSKASSGSNVEEPRLASVSYLKDIQPIFDHRCIACHGCLGSPCNLKLSSFRGVDRGAFGKNPYSFHLESYLRTGIDVLATTSQWRKRGFYPVLSRDGTAEQRLVGSMLYQLIATGYKHNKPGFSRNALMPTYKDRYKHVCQNTAKLLAESIKTNPVIGMPYGLPALDSSEVKAVQSWVENGAPGPTKKELNQVGLVKNPKIVAQWEEFFNSSDVRQQLVSRYIFDHVYLSTVTLAESPGDLFKLVRSKTAGMSPKEALTGNNNPIELIDTPHPYDNPMEYAKVKHFYYRLKKITSIPVQKNHFVWHLQEKDILHLQKLFLSPKWNVSSNDDSPWNVGNPFLMYQAIPAKVRYRFMLENSAVIVGGITSGPVCLGQTATYAVKDHFWVYFIDPKYDVSILSPKLGLKNWEELMDRSSLGNDRYEKAYGKMLNKFFPQGYSINEVWDGEKTNPNAWLTILRHESNTWVIQGRQGGFPRSQWLIGYNGFERIYYDTVANFAYYGSGIKKLETLGFFNFLRQEFEDNFLLLLPKDKRIAIRNNWTQGIGAIELYFSDFPGENLPSQIEKKIVKHPLVRIVKKLEKHLGPIVSGPPDLLNPLIKNKSLLKKEINGYDSWEQAVSTITVTTKYKFPQYMPSLIMLKLNYGNESRVYSLVTNRVYKTQYTLLFQNGEALPNLYTMSVYPTVVGGFPNLFMELDLKQASDFLREMIDIQTLADFLEFRDRYAVLRNQDNFWKTYDWFNNWNFTNRKEEAGVFDLSYYDLFDSVY